MDSNYFTSPLTLIVSTLFDLYVLIVLLRFMLQLMRADPHNSVSQFIIKSTSPPLRYLRRFIPSVFGQDASAIVLCLIVTYAKFVLLRLLDTEVVHINNTIAYIGGVSYLGLLIYSIADLVSLFLSIFSDCHFNPGNPELDKPRHLQPGHRSCQYPGDTCFAPNTKTDPSCRGN